MNAGIRKTRLVSKTARHPKFESILRAATGLINVSDANEWGINAIKL
jgi:hypothetical protein